MSFSSFLTQSYTGMYTPCAMQVVNALAPPIHKLPYQDAFGRTGWLNATASNTTERKERQLLETLGDLLSRLWFSSDYDDEAVSEHIALSDVINV